MVATAPDRERNGNCTVESGQSPQGQERFGDVGEGRPELGHADETVDRRRARQQPGDQTNRFRRPGKSCQEEEGQREEKDRRGRPPRSERREAPPFRDTPIRLDQSVRIATL